jgi:FkbM family methyltransferase
MTPALIETVPGQAARWAALIGGFSKAGGMAGRRSSNLLRACFVDLIGDLRVAASLEIGAHEAAFSRIAREAHPALKALAFEALRENYDRFRAEFDFPALGIDYQRLAISDVDGEIEFMVQHRPGVPEFDHRWSNSILQRVDPRVEYRPETVVCRRLDTLLPEIGMATASLALWIDVEGAQRQVLAGSESVMAQVQCALIEVETRAFWDGQMLATDIVTWFDERGFAPVARDFEYDQQFNLIFVRKQDVAAKAVNRGVERCLKRHETLIERIAEARNARSS